jgi:mono/diheme cytochrome c family protein
MAACVVFVFTANLPSCNSARPVVNNGADSLKVPATPVSADAQKWSEGKDLFKSNCAACHNPKADGTGPSLRGVTSRWQAAGDYQGKTGRQWLNVWIRNWDDVVNAGYKYGVDMANSRPAQMNRFPSLSDQQIDKILYYVENDKK